MHTQEIIPSRFTRPALRNSSSARGSHVSCSQARPPPSPLAAACARPRVLPAHAASGGALLYAPVRAVLGLHVLDPVCKEDIVAFHRWMNDERVNCGWDEKGVWERHVEYVSGVMDDPHVLPLIMSWDGARMGYDNHVAPYVPAGAQDYDRKLHDLHKHGPALGNYIFLEEARTARVVGEPKRANATIVRMHLETSFYLPYKHSVMTMNLRERLFKEDVFH
ncbi:hypothetical protein DFH11DRAFT_1729617 [Phellopilus nigrolimitatus]|nr:hypothetical protein DFH11DRAFT_1729617 [Phellopilus nigrolimitatus]